MNNEQIDEFNEYFGSTKGNRRLSMDNGRGLKTFGEIFHASKGNRQSSMDDDKGLEELVRCLVHTKEVTNHQ